WGRAPAMFFAVCVALWLLFQLAQMLFEQPISAIELQGRFERVNPVDLEARLQANLGTGFFAADLGSVREQLEALPWVDRVHVRRAWPDRLHVSVVEHVPAARWGAAGLLNTRGELFVHDAQHVPAELPHLSGPPGTEIEVAAQYLALHAAL